jgi:hypothetical protein
VDRRASAEVLPEICQDKSRTGKVYAGRTSGYGTPLQNIALRDYGHDYNDLGYGPAQLDQSSTNADAIRGRKQMLIDYFVSLGISGNRDRNPVVTNRVYYIEQAINEFGGCRELSYTTAG